MARSYDIEPSRWPWRRGRRQALAAMLLIGIGCLLSSNAWARDPLRPGLPACEGGEAGYWQPVTIKRADGKTVTHLAITAVDFLDPATVICWLDGPQTITAGSRPGKVPIKSKPIERKESVGGSRIAQLRAIYHDGTP